MVASVLREGEMVPIAAANTARPPFPEHFLPDTAVPFPFRAV